MQGRRLQPEAREGRRARSRRRGLRRRGQRAALLRGREGAARLASRRHQGREGAQRRSAARRRSSTSRRAPAARVTARSARRITSGGGMAHALEPQDWSYRPPRKVRIGALKSALSLFAKEGRLIVVDSLELAEIKTKALAGRSRTLKADKKALVVDAAANEKLVLSIRNLRGSPVPAARGRQRLRPPPPRPPRRLEGRGQGARGALPASRRRRRPCSPSNIIRRPIILTEKSSRLREKSNKVIFEVAPRREQDPDQGRDPDALQRRACVDVNTMRHARQGQAHGARLRQAAELEEGDRHPQGGRRDPVLRREKAE